MKANLGPDDTNHTTPIWFNSKFVFTDIKFKDIFVGKHILSEHLYCLEYFCLAKKSIGDFVEYKINIIFLLME